MLKFGWIYAACVYKIATTGNGFCGGYFVMGNPRVLTIDRRYWVEVGQDGFVGKRN
jgi:hypothetical protein